MNLRVPSLEAMLAVGAALGAVANPNTVVLLCGDLGAGKTQFAKGVAAGLGLDTPVTSPTFNIVLEYHAGRLSLYHFDLYRLEDAAELEDIDLFALLEAGGVSLIEWGDKFFEALPDDCITVTISIDGAATRVIDARAGGTQSLAVLDKWQEALSC